MSTPATNAAPPEPRARVPFLRCALVLAAASLGSLGVGCGLWLGAIAVTARGRWLVVLMVTLAVLPLRPLMLRLHPARSVERRRWNQLSGILCLLALSLILGLVASSPTGKPAPGSPARHRFSSGNEFPRFSVANLVPEIEQVNLGFHLVPLVDGLLTPDRTTRLARFTMDYYQQMERSPDFHALGSAMGAAYADLLGFSYPAGHYYLYVPRSAPTGPLPALVVLHGSAGNFKVYTWIWSQLAEELGCVIIAPSFGFGAWDRAGSVETVQRALADAQAVVSLDARRIHLAGLSNGGLGVSLVADALPRRFCGCIFISPVMADTVTDSDAFQHKWAGRPMLVLTGEDDERVPVTYVRHRVRHLQAGGVQTKLVTYPGEDHFLFFSQRTPVLQEILAWLRAHPQ